MRLQLSEKRGTAITGEYEYVQGGRAEYIAAPGVDESGPESRYLARNGVIALSVVRLGVSQRIAGR